MQSAAGTWESLFQGAVGAAWAWMALLAIRVGRRSFCRGMMINACIAVLSGRNTSEVLERYESNLFLKERVPEWITQFHIF